MSHLPTVWLKENQVRLVGSSRSFTCNYKIARDLRVRSALFAMGQDGIPGCATCQGPPRHRERQKGGESMEEKNGDDLDWSPHLLGDWSMKKKQQMDSEWSII